MYFRTEGIIISQKNFGEADKLLKIYTKDNGKISAIAKGARRPLSKKSGHVELGNWCKIFVARGKNIDLLTEVEIKKVFPADNLTPESTNKIYHLLEIVDSLTVSGQKNPNVFFILLKFLDRTSRGEEFNLVSSVFKIKLLSQLGFFSTINLKDSSTKKFLQKLEKEDFESLKKSVKITSDAYLKLLAFLDSMIESLAEKQLKTTKFLNGKL